MSISKSRYYSLKPFQVGELFRAFLEPNTSLGEGLVFQGMIFQERHPDGSLSTNVHTDLLPLETVCDLSAFSFYLSYTHPESGKLDVSVSARSNTLVVEARADSSTTLTGALDLLEKRLSLEPYTEPTKKPDQEDSTVSLADLDARLQALEHRYVQQAEFRCFMSYRFTEANELQALRLQHFLNLLGVRVTTGASYEPRRVTDKILSKLKNPMDFIVVLVTEEGESFWTRDETGVAIHRGLPLIPVVQKGASFAQGLFGDVEYIPFDKGHIGDAFLKVLEAVIFIRNQAPRDASATVQEA